MSKLSDKTASELKKIFENKEESVVDVVSADDYQKYTGQVSAYFEGKWILDFSFLYKKDLKKNSATPNKYLVETILLDDIVDFLPIDKNNKTHKSMNQQNVNILIYFREKDEVYQIFIQILLVQALP